MTRDAVRSPSVDRHPTPVEAIALHAHQHAGKPF